MWPRVLIQLSHCDWFKMEMWLKLSQSESSLGLWLEPWGKRGSVYQRWLGWTDGELLEGKPPERSQMPVIDPSAPPSSSRNQDWSRPPFTASFPHWFRKSVLSTYCIPIPVPNRSELVQAWGVPDWVGKADVNLIITKRVIINLGEWQVKVWGTGVREGFLEEVVLGPNGEERPEQQEQRPCGRCGWWGVGEGDG